MKRNNVSAAAEGGNKRRREDSGGETRIYVGNLSFKVDEEIMRKHFGACGRVLHVDFITDRATGKFYGTAFVDFESSDSARKALAFNGQKLLGRPIKVEFPKQQSKQQQPQPKPKEEEKEEKESASKEVEKIPGCKSVFVSRLPQSVTDDAMYEEFSRDGNVIGLRWVDNKSTKSPLICGFVEFDDEDSAVRAVRRLNGVKALGAHGVLRVNLAPDRPYVPKKPTVGPQTDEQNESHNRFDDGEDDSVEGTPQIAPQAPKTTIIVSNKH